MKIIKYLSLILAVTLTVSCEKHVIEFDATPVADKAEFQLHYMAPVPAVAANNITKVEINGQLFANIKAPLNTYNAIPSGSVGKFYAVDPGSVRIKMYTGTDMAKKVYDQTVTLTAGKQNVFVHDTTKVPIVFDNGYPFTVNITEITDSTCWIKFYNFLYETAGVRYILKLQYRYLNPRKITDTINIGSPVSFGETTGWQPVKVKKSVAISAGYARIDYFIHVIDASGNDLGPLKVMKSDGKYAKYTDYWTGYIGRRYHHTMSGMRATTLTSAVRVFTAL
jgi:hypothetical protein